MTGTDTQAEREVIAAILSDKKNLEQAIEHLDADDFTTQEARKLFLMATEMYDNNADVNTSSVLLKNKTQIQNFGKDFNYIDYVSLLVYGGIDSRTERLKECTKVRRLIGLMRNVKKSLENGVKTDDIYSDIEMEMVNNTNTGFNRSCLTGAELADIGEKAMIDRTDKEKLKAKVIYTQYPTLNKAIGGFEYTDLIVVTAKSGGGKTAFCSNITDSIACVQKIATAYINTEMSDEQLALRKDATFGGVDHMKIRNGEVTKEEIAKVKSGLDVLRNSKLYMVTVPDLQVNILMKTIRSLHRKYKVKLVVIDYIGRMDTVNNASKKDWEILKAATMKLKTLAQKLGLVVIMVCQLNENDEIAQASYIKHEASLWLNLISIPLEHREKTYPWNICAEIKKSRNSGKDNYLWFYYKGNQLVFTDNRKKAEEWNQQDKLEEAETIEDFGEAIPLYKPAKKSGTKYSKNTTKD